MKPFFIALMLIVSPAIQAQDLSLARESLLDALGDRMQLLDESFAHREDENGESRYWILRLRANEIGNYAISHHYSNRNGRYEPRTAEYKFQIRPSRTQRCAGPKQGISPMGCVGDSMLLVLNISPRYKEHMFTLEYSELEPYRSRCESFAQHQADPSIPVENPIHESLSCLATKPTCHILSRSMRGPPSCMMYVVCEATKTAEFNLDFSVDVDGVEARHQGDSIPVQIVPAKQPINHLIWNSWIRVFDGYAGWSVDQWHIGQDAVFLREGDALIIRLPLSGPVGRDEQVCVIIRNSPFNLEVGSIQDQLGQDTKGVKGVR
jgi:hypothetical protein